MNSNTKPFKFTHFNQHFIIIDLKLKQIFQIDTVSFKLNNLAQLSIDCLFSTVTSNNQLYILSNDQTTLLEFNINTLNSTILPPIQLNSAKIIQLMSAFDHLLLHTDDNQAYLWWRKNEPITRLEKAYRIIPKGNRLVLVCTDNKSLIVYDLKENLRGTIRLEENAGPCEAIDLSDNNKEGEQYLFLICQDRFLRMYRVSNGKQIAKLFIHTDLNPFIGVLNNRVLLKVANHLCIIKIIDKKSLPKR